MQIAAESPRCQRRTCLSDSSSPEPTPEWAKRLSQRCSAPPSTPITGSRSRRGHAKGPTAAPWNAWRELPRAKLLPETYRFSPPVSPHLAAKKAGVTIELSRIQMPDIGAKENLIVEGAGGALVPINETQLMTDLMRHLGLPVLLVARTALGTINHTLLSLAALRSARLERAWSDHSRQTERGKPQGNRALWTNWSRRCDSLVEED